MASFPREIEISVHASFGLVRPGDKLIIGVNQPVDAQRASRIIERLSARLPGVEVMIIDDIASMAVYRPGDDDGQAG